MSTSITPIHTRRRTIMRAKSSWCSCINPKNLTRMSCRCYIQTTKGSVNVFRPPPQRRLTLAAVFPHVWNAFPAAAIAALVSSSPISGIVPSSSSVAGSIAIGQEPCMSIRVPTHEAEPKVRVPTRHGDPLAPDRVDPFSVNVPLRLDQRWILESPLEATSELSVCASNSAPCGTYDAGVGGACHSVPQRRAGAGCYQWRPWCKHSERYRRGQVSE